MSEPEGNDKFIGTYWIEKFSGRLVQIIEFEMFYDRYEEDENDPANWGVRYRYNDDSSFEFIGVNLFKKNYRYYKTNLNRLDLVMHG